MRTLGIENDSFWKSVCHMCTCGVDFVAGLSHMRIEWMSSTHRLFVAYAYASDRKWSCMYKCVSDVYLRYTIYERVVSYVYFADTFQNAIL